MFFLLSSKLIFAELLVGKISPNIVLEGDLGSRLDDTQWYGEERSSGEVIIQYYVDPYESDHNNHVSQALNAEKLPLEKYGFVAVIKWALPGC